MENRPSVAGSAPSFRLEKVARMSPESRGFQRKLLGLASGFQSVVGMVETCHHGAVSQIPGLEARSSYNGWQD
jgi:hypothetical protein